MNPEHQDTIKDTFINFFKHGEADILYALKNVTLDIYPGEFLGIIGRNGSGKSTLLKTIVGIYRQNGGEIEVKGKIVPFLELGVGFNPRLPARDNIYLNGTILGMTRKEIDEQFDEIVRFAGIKRFLDTPVKNFSSGMKVRLAFSVAIQTQGDIYILDEVLSVGDIQFRKKCIQKMKELVEQQKTIIYVSHAMPNIREYCDRVIWLDDGQVKGVGQPKDMIRKYSASVGLKD